jgi:hypothetical protein
MCMMSICISRDFCQPCVIPLACLYLLIFEGPTMIVNQPFREGLCIPKVQGLELDGGDSTINNAHCAP